ncbi:hypothetical protein KSS87_021006 [Heliosperma pusillum]|nr:hypothetical protein KSS87_021006 [Heliosperma pusillum]
MPLPNHPATPPPSSPPHPPTIGKIGPYTVFVTPPVTAKPSPSPYIAVPRTTAPPPVQLPPIQYPTSPVDRFAFLRHSLLKLQHVHASVDEYMANWLGLDQSKYQWALNDYYQAHPLEKDVLTKEVSNKSQTV